MPFPPGYIYDLNEKRIRIHFPNLKIGENGNYTSEKGDQYNCAAWAVQLEDEWIQFEDAQGNLDLSIERYITYYKNHGFEVGKNPDLEIGIIKIAIYANENKEFKHVARQLTDGQWTSKIGDWEDIEHKTLDVVTGKSYGKPHVIMQKKQTVQILTKNPPI